jgi:hypothetical protein
MKGMLVLAAIVVAIALAGCGYSATVEAYNWTDSPPRDVECEVDGKAKVVPGEIDEYPWMESWKVRWPSSGADSHNVGVRVRELYGPWSNVASATVVNGDILYVDIFEGVFYLSKGEGPDLSIELTNEPPDLDELKARKEGRTQQTP